MGKGIKFKKGKKGREKREKGGKVKNLKTNKKNSEEFRGRRGGKEFKKREERNLEMEEKRGIEVKNRESILILFITGSYDRKKQNRKEFLKVLKGSREGGEGFLRVAIIYTPVSSNVYLNIYFFYTFNIHNINTYILNYNLINLSIVQKLNNEDNCFLYTVYTQIF